MILEITPPPGEVTQWTPWSPRTWRRAFAYGTGLIGSTTAVGAASGAFGAFARASAPIGQHMWVAGVAACAFAYGMHELALIRLPTPQLQWQVPAQWSKYGKTTQALLYGVVLGAEIFTFIPYAAFYILILLDATMGPAGGAALGFVYGLARVSPTLKGTAYALRQGSADRIVGHIVGAGSRFHMMNGVALTVVGAVLVGALLTA